MALLSYFDYCILLGINSAQAAASSLRSSTRTKLDANDWMVASICATFWDRFLRTCSRTAEVRFLPDGRIALGGYQSAVGQQHDAMSWKRLPDMRQPGEVRVLPSCFDERDRTVGWSQTAALRRNRARATTARQRPQPAHPRPSSGSPAQWLAPLMAAFQGALSFTPIEPDQSTTKTIFV